VTGLYDPFDPDQVDNPDEALTEMRRSNPVAEIRPGMWYLSRHEDILSVCRDPMTFRQSPFQPLTEDNRSPDELQMGETDPPIHTEMRRLFSAALNPSAIRRYEPDIQRVCDTLVDRMLAKRHSDLIAEFAAPIPALVIAHLIGMDDDQAEQLRAYSAAFLESIDIGVDTATAADASRRTQQFDEALRDLVRDRTHSPNPRPDLLTAMIKHRDAHGRALSETKILTHLAKDLISAGVETTTHVLGNLFYDILSTDGCMESLRRNPGLIPAAVEESLRFRPPVQLLFRRAATDTQIRDTPIPAGAIVALGYASANHDEAAFTCPDRFDIQRGEQVRNHLGFGWGIHTCVGAPLARLELRTAAATLISRAPTLSLDPAQTYERVRFYMMRGPRQLWVNLSSNSESAAAES
jgi:cytochrome P450